MEEKKAIIQTDKLCKSFSVGGVQHHIIKNMDLSIYGGDFTVIMGSSGAGKSTLLYALSGMDKASLGKVNFSEKNITKFNSDQLAIFRRRHCGFVFQQIHLIGTMSILDYNKLQGIEHEANKTVLHNDAYITLYPSEGGATTQGEVTIGHKTSEASGNYGQYNSTNTEIISQSSESGYYKFDSVGFTVDGAGHITNAKQHEVRIPIANATRDGLISSLDYLKISEDVVSRVTATAPIVATIENGNELTISHTTTGANSLKGESTDLPALQFGDNFKTLRESVDQYGLTTLLEEKEVTIPSYTADNRRNGLMSSLDKMKLDAFDEAWNYATTDYVNAALSGLDPMVFKGVVDSYSELPQKTNPDGPNYDPDLSNG